MAVTVTLNGKDVDLTPHFMKLTGQDYLKVPGRVLMFRAAMPKGGIQTELVEHDRQAGWAQFKATILSEGGAILATAYGSESKAGFKDYLEKAETVAIGRALALAGFGTQFATSDFYEDEETKLADSPVKAAAKTQTKETTVKESTVQEAKPQGAPPPATVLADAARQRALLFTQIADARKAASMSKTELQEWMIAEKYPADPEKISVDQLKAMLAYVKSQAKAAS